MSVSNQSTVTQYTGNGITYSFNFPYKFFAPSDLLVVLTTAGVDAVQTLGASYTVSGANVVFSTAPAAGVLVTIYSAVPLSQDVDYVSQDNFPAESHETALDRLTVMCQDLKQLVLRTLRVPMTSSQIAELSRTERANKVLQFDSSGDLELAPTASSSAATAQTAAQESQAAAALAEAARLAAGLYAEAAAGGAGIWNVKTGDFTASNDAYYRVTASCTVTNPSPVSGKGYIIDLRAGSVTIGGNTFASPTVILAAYISSAWSYYTGLTVNTSGVINSGFTLPSGKTMTIAGTLTGTGTIDVRGASLLGAPSSKSAAIKNAQVVQLKRLHFRAFAAERMSPPEIDFSFETVANVSALAALDMFVGQANIRFTRVTSTGDVWMASSDGVGLAHWVKCRADFIHVGDSMAMLKFMPMWKKLWRQYGFGGYLATTTYDNDDRSLPGMVLGNGAVYAKSSNGPGVADDYQFWPSGLWVSLPAGGTIEVGMFDDDYETQIFLGFYIGEIGAGTIKLQSRTHVTDWADESGYTAIDASATSGAQVLRLNKSSKAKRKFRLVGVSGTTKVPLCGALNESGFAIYQLARGGELLANWVLWPNASATTVLSAIDPALITLDCKDVSPGGETATFSAALAAFEAKLSTAGIAATTDVLYLGSSVDSDSSQETQNPVMLSHAETYGRMYIDMAEAGETYAKTNAAFGGYVDSTHLYGPASWSLSDIVLRCLRLESGVHRGTRVHDRLKLQNNPVLDQDYPLLSALRGATVAQKREHPGFVTSNVSGQGDSWMFAPISLTTGDWTACFWVTLPASLGSGTKAFWRISSSNTTGNVASSIGMEFDNGQDLLLLLMKNAAADSERRQSIRWVIQNFAGKTVLVTVKRASGKMMVNFNGVPCGDFYDEKDELTGSGRLSYVFSTTGSTPPAWGDAIAGSYLLLGKGINSTWSAIKWHEVAVWYSALTDAQIQEYSLTGVAPTGAAALWRFQEGAGRYAYDDSGNGVLGTFTTGSAQQFNMWERPSKTRFITSFSPAFSSSIAAGASDSKTVTVSGAKVGDRATVSRADGTMPTAGLFLDAAVTATDTVTVRYFNASASAITPGTQLHVVEVAKATA